MKCPNIEKGKKICLEIIDQIKVLRYINNNDERDKMLREIHFKVVDYFNELDNVSRHDIE